MKTLLNIMLSIQIVLLGPIAKAQTTKLNECEIQVQECETIAKRLMNLSIQQHQTLQEYDTELGRVSTKLIESQRQLQEEKQKNDNWYRDAFIWLGTGLLGGMIVGSQL